MSWFIFVVFNILKHFNGKNLAAILCKICKLLEWPDALRLMQHLDCDSKGFILLFHIYKLKLMYITTIFNSDFYATKDAIMIAHSIDKLSEFGFLYLSRWFTGIFWFYIWPQFSQIENKEKYHLFFH